MKIVHNLAHQLICMANIVRLNPKQISMEKFIIKQT